MLGRLLTLSVAAAALAGSSQAVAAASPILRSVGDVLFPRAQTAPGSAAAGRGRVTVIVDLPLPPLAAQQARTTAGLPVRRLELDSSSSRAYLARLESEQTVAAAELRREIPEARISASYRIVLDAFAVDLPAGRLARLARLHFVRKVYATMRYTAALDHSPGVIGADVLQQTTGARGDGVKIAIVDDGIDQKNPFFRPADLVYPAGFPKGNRSYTTPKVIVARSFPTVESGPGGKLPFDPQRSFHGTHVAGIAAGDAGTDAPAGPDHPPTAGLTGVAPRAYLGNYRVFTIPTRYGLVAETQQVVSAFEAAAADGMDVVNFSGGGPEIDPRSDALIEAVHNLAAAGIIPVISAGNDRDQFGYGTVGSPATAPDAIAVAAVSNTHVFAPALSVVSPGAPASLQNVPVQGAGGNPAPARWSVASTAIVDVTTLTAGDGRRVDRYLCGPSTPRPGALTGAIALVDRGACPFTEKSDRAKRAGATGILVVDNRPGEAEQVPLALSLPAGMIADLDGARLAGYLASRGGRGQIRLSRSTEEIETGRSGIVMNFSSAGPTAFGHGLKPDIAAPGGQILSSAGSSFNGSRFAVLDGTSMAAPHVTGAAALLREEHPGWTVGQVRSALISTGSPAWADTARKHEASVLLAGGGIVDLPSANDPRIFTTPATVSVGTLDARNAPIRRTYSVELDDAGNGSGTWRVSVHAQSRSRGASLSAPPSVTVPAGGTAALALRASVAGSATAGDDSGFVVLSQGDVARRIPYDFSISRPRLSATGVMPLASVQRGDTRRGTSRVSVYSYPTAPFGLGAFPAEAPMNESGAEHVYVLTVRRPLVNVGVRVTDTSRGGAVDVFVLGALDESTVQGYAGIPVDVNSLTDDYANTIGVAGLTLPRPGRYYVVVDSTTAQAGSYVLRLWTNDVTPPTVRLLTTSVASGAGVLVARVSDGGSGVDPGSLSIALPGAPGGLTHVAAASYEAKTGLAFFPLTNPLEQGRQTITVAASDYQEAKNIDPPGHEVLPNTTSRRSTLAVVDRTVVTWLAPDATGCVRGRVRLQVAASSPEAGHPAVQFLADGVTIASVVSASGVYRAWWSPTEPGHTYRLVAASGTASARLRVRTCG